MRKQLWAAAVLFACAVAPAYSALVALNLTAQISDVSSGLTSQLAVGESVSATFSYDTSIADIFPDADLGEFPASFSVNALFGGYPVGGSGGGVFVANDRDTGFGPSDFFTSFLTDAEISGAAIGAFAPVRLELTLEDYNATVFSSDQLPPASQLANVSEFEIPFIVLFFQNAAGDFEIAEATITGLQPQQVPEPYAIALLACAFVMLALTRRRGAIRRG